MALTGRRPSGHGFLVRPAFALLLAAVAASPRGGCGTGGAAYDPCQGKACGEACQLCPPDAPHCVETAVVKACDATGNCVAAGTVTACFDPCDGKSCGDVCDPCVPGLPCPMTAVAYQCDGSKRCLLPGRGTSCDACAGKACGTQCAIDPPCYPLCLMPSFPGACDGLGFCVPPDQAACAR